MEKRQPNKNKKIRAITVLLFFCIISGSFFSSQLIFITFGSETGILPTPTPNSNKTRAKSPTHSQPRVSKYSAFSHNTHLGLKIACDSCHKFPTANWEKVRSKETAFPDVTDYPKHESCLNCHRQQFFSGRPPAICANCHLKPSPNDSSRFPFANPREIFDASPKGKNKFSAFEISFPHDKHIAIVSQNEIPFDQHQNGVSFVKAGIKRSKEESCKVCHQTLQPQEKSADEFFTPPPKDLGDAFWLKKGTFKTAPIGHAICFTCHSTDTGILPAQTDCATCHQLKQPSPTPDFDQKLADKIGVTDKLVLSDWRRRDSSGTFRHEFDSHAELDCAACHNVSAMNTTEAKTKKVPVLSCSPCHITATSDDGGILNYEIDERKKNPNFQCVKCHISFGKSAIPDTHTKAIAEAGGK